MALENDKPKLVHTLNEEGETTWLSFSGRMDAKAVTTIWHQAFTKIRNLATPRLTLNIENTRYLDTAGAIFLISLERLAIKKEKTVSISGSNPAFDSLLDLARKTKTTAAQENPPISLTFIENNGKWLADQLSDGHDLISRMGQIIWAMVQSIRRPGAIRWADTLRIAERAGVNALPIVALISFIVGLVMAFQAAIPMRMFGAELYVSNLIGIAMVRELGPLMTAIVLAGRSGSAFAAEIGTMRINEEIDALTVMGIDPIQFLIIPRIIASTIMTPMLTLFANLIGILGGALVITSMGYPIISYYNQIVSFVTLSDLTGGLIKCFVFGILIAATGCIRGYQTQSGPSAVGDSTTRAVVSGIILIAVFDGIFSIIYYYLGI